MSDPRQVAKCSAGAYLRFMRDQDELQTRSLHEGRQLGRMHDVQRRIDLIAKEP
jgi:hypothetical protein